MVQEGDVLWTPSARFAEGSEMAKFMRWLKAERGLAFADYMALQAWSVSHYQDFWAAVWDYFEVMSDAPYTAVIDEAIMPGARWFIGSKVNYAEHMMRGERMGDPNRTALVSLSEVRPRAQMSWAQMTAHVRRLATSLRERGIGPGDRVVSYMPNIPETLIAMLAVTAIGAIWSSAAPEFGTSAVVDRFSQIAPKLMFACDGYRFNGKDFDRKSAVAEIAAALPTLEQVVFLPYLDESASAPALGVPVSPFAELLAGPAVSEDAFRFERVAHDHPLWILFSSGTTGLPKAIVHPHAAMLVYHLQAKSFHMNMHPGQRLFFYTTTGWMMWNALISVLLSGASIILYDGSPTYPQPDFLWKLTEECEATSFGASPTFVQGMQKLGIVPKDRFDLSKLESILLAGSPALPETFSWFYESVKADLWLTSQSGGTELCGAIVGASPLMPVKAGEIQCPVLGVDAKAFDDEGRAVVGQMGELVITTPAPHMPLYFWNDPDGRKYFEAYFDVYPGVWRHGDYIKINADGGSIIYGRSDSTLNRHGVRIGTSEIYRAVETLPQIADSLVVMLEPQPGHHVMELFVTLKGGAELDEALKKTINDTLRKTFSPRHVPDLIIAMPAIPYTLSGKKMEVPVRKILQGISPDKAASRDSMSNPAALDPFIAYARAKAA